MLEEILESSEGKMTKGLDRFASDLAKIRTGRAHPSLIEHLQVEYYGQNVPLNQVANIVVEDSRTLLVTPWEKPMATVVDKAIRSSDLGVNPVTAGTAIRVPLPALTEERRRELVKLVGKEGEQAKIAIRQARKDANQQIKDLLKAKTISEDDERRYQEKVQTLTDSFVKKVDERLAEKEAELMQI